jgi:hypothetical protein
MHRMARTRPVHSYIIGNMPAGAGTPGCAIDRIHQAAKNRISEHGLITPPYAILPGCDVQPAGLR